MDAVSDDERLCRDLLRADDEATVVRLLKRHGYWDRPEFWRPYGDVENNWGRSGNRQSLAEAALVEKVVNSVDARLINARLINEHHARAGSSPPIRRPLDPFARPLHASLATAPTKTTPPATASGIGATQRSARSPKA